MPLYCENCMKLVEGPSCPRCRNRKLRDVAPGDFCLVADVHYMQAEMLKELFADNDIPCTERSALGAGITVNLGVNVGTVRLYVPYDRLDFAKELYDVYFNSPEAPSTATSRADFIASRTSRSIPKRSKSTSSTASCTATGRFGSVRRRCFCRRSTGRSIPTLCRNTALSRMTAKRPVNLNNRLISAYSCIGCMRPYTAILHDFSVMRM